MKLLSIQTGNDLRMNIVLVQQIKSRLSWANRDILPPNSNILGKVHIISKTSISGDNNLILLFINIKH